MYRNVHALRGGAVELLSEDYEHIQAELARLIGDTDPESTREFSEKLADVNAKLLDLETTPVSPKKQSWTDFVKSGLTRLRSNVVEAILDHMEYNAYKSNSFQRGFHSGRVYSIDGDLGGLFNRGMNEMTDNFFSWQARQPPRRRDWSRY